jgi:CheY-like chemotaxis protein
MPGTKKKVLIVEDELLIQMVTRQLIEKEGFVVCGMTTSGEEAVELARSLKPDMILMDIKLENEMDGITAMELIHGFAEIPVIYVSGNSDDITRRRIDTTNYLHFFTKPVDYQKLTALMHAYFGNKKLKE